jgi:hypothetical protein
MADVTTWVPPKSFCKIECIEFCLDFCTFKGEELVELTVVVVFIVELLMSAVSGRRRLLGFPT